MDTSQQVEQQSAAENILQELSDPEIQEALVSLIRKLPQVAEALTAAERGMAFVTAVANDRASLGYLLERMEQTYQQLDIGPETVEALVILLEKLPKLAKMAVAVEQWFDFIQAVLQDKESLRQLMEGAKELSAPVTGPLRDTMSLLQEAKQRSAAKQETITLFALLKMLKDPTVQKGLQFAQAFLEVVGERKQLNR